MVDVDIRVSSHLKQQLAWAADKQIQVISTIIELGNIPVIPLIEGINSILV